MSDRPVENDAPWCPECGPACPLHGIFGSPLPQSRHAFWGSDPSGYCACQECEPTAPLPPGRGGND